MKIKNLLVVLALFTNLTVVTGICVRGQSTARLLPGVYVRSATPLRLPGARWPEAGILDGIDCNSPLHWDAQGRLHVFASALYPYHSAGPDIFRLNNPIFGAQRVSITPSARAPINGHLWLEATHRDNNGLLYGWYHNERGAGCANTFLTKPYIGAMVSRDEGQSWQDLGIIMQAAEAMTDCATGNFFFAGGEGDFSVVLDQTREHFYFFFGSYHKEISEQGICVARLAYADRNDPVGKVWKWHKGQWREPGLNGHTTPLLPVLTDWHRRDANALWGPSVHYNTYLDHYVMVLNHAINGEWNQEGIYLSYNKSAHNPAGWSTPVRLPIDPQGSAYPQIVGLQRGETDKLVGAVGKLFLHGESRYELVFLRPGEGAGTAYYNNRPMRAASSTRTNFPRRGR